MFFTDFPVEQGILPVEIPEILVAQEQSSQVIYTPMLGWPADNPPPR